MQLWICVVILYQAHTYVDKATGSLQVTYDNIKI